MTASQQYYGIIPARYASTRFPGKPLAQILGKPMIWHVYQRALQCETLEKVYVATDDERIREAAERLSIPVVMTRKEHQSGTDRVLEAVQILNIPEDSVVINIQGDEPALHPEMIDQLIAPFTDPAVVVSTLARKIDPDAARSPDQVKVIVGKNRDALYFSRAPIPYPRDDGEPYFMGHIGLYAFRLPILEQFVRLPCGELERIEKLEQLRLLENLIPIRVVITEHQSIGVDRPEDIKKVSRIIEQSGFGSSLNKGESC